MKLNLGCGKEYKKGFINIDSYDLTVADKKMSVDNLKYPPNTIEEIHAQQLIEHFGFLKIVYILAEWFRVLKPGGILLIETPHLEESFKRFLDGTLETRKEIITWIFGLDSQGMTHHFCFPEELLRTTLKKTGFRDIHKTYFEEEKNHPDLRIICKKPHHYQSYQIITDFRRKLSQEHIFNPEDYLLSIEQEKLIDFFTPKIQELLKNKVHTILDEIIIEGGIKSPKMTSLLFQEFLKHNILVIEEAQKYIEILGFLTKVNYSTILFQLLKEMPDTAGTQRKMFQIVNNIGKQTIKKMLKSPKENHVVQHSLKKLSKKNTTSLSIFFAEEIIQTESEILFRQGIKEFTQKNYDNAIIKIKTAITLERNNLLFFWNLARLYQLKNAKSAGKKNYDSAIKLLEISNHTKKENLLTVLKTEKKQFTPRKHGKPIKQV